MQNIEHSNHFPEVTDYIKYPDPNQNAPFNKATHPSDKPIITKHIFAVDSRQRDYSYYPRANNYNISIPDRYRNVTGIELKAAMLPRTEYNVNSVNKYLDYSIGDYFKTISYNNDIITNDGKPVDPGTYNLTIESPKNPGTQAVIKVLININNRIENYTIIIAGSGYLHSNLPKVSLFDFKEFNVKIGIQYISELREGQYVIGGNPQFLNNSDKNNYQSWTPSKLVSELEATMSYGILKDTKYCYSRKPWTTLNSTATPIDIENFTEDYPLLFNSRIMSQYPIIDTFNSKSSTNDIPDNYDTNSCKFNRLYFTNTLILRTESSPSSSQLEGTSTFSDSNGFEYTILKYDLIPSSDNYILYCKLENPLKKISGNYWKGLEPGTLGNFSANLAHWEFLFATGMNYVINSASLIGFNKRNYFNPINNNSIIVNESTLIPKGLSYSTENDYYLFGDPEYIVLSFRPKYGGNALMGINDRVDSCNNSNIDRVFACLIYDTVQPAVLQDVSSGKSISTLNSISDENNKLNTFVETSSSGSEVLVGNTGNQNVSDSKTPGMLKAMKGADFDRKVVQFPQPVAQIYKLNIRFTKFSRGAIGSDEELYNFHGKEHLLLFEITCGDLLTGKRS